MCVSHHWPSTLSEEQPPSRHVLRRHFRVCRAHGGKLSFISLSGLLHLQLYFAHYSEVHVFGVKRLMFQCQFHLFSILLLFFLTQDFTMYPNTMSQSSVCSPGWPPASTDAEMTDRHHFSTPSSVIQVKFPIPSHPCQFEKIIMQQPLKLSRPSVNTSFLFAQLKHLFLNTSCVYLVFLGISNAFYRENASVYLIN